MTKTNAVDFDMLAPPEIAAKAAQAGLKKAQMDLVSMLMLSILAGIFIGLAANFATITVTGAESLPFGVRKLLAGLVFCLGLILVVIAGAELFTGNNLLVMAVLSRKVAVRYLLRNWVTVYAGNLAGSVLVAWMIWQTGQNAFADGAVGRQAVALATAKCTLGWSEAFWRGVLCNALVCWAIWKCFSARSTGDRILAIIFPIAAFVACGFEHCVANMYFIPMGLLEHGSDAATGLTWTHFVTRNLIPVTLGNIVGGAGLVGAVFWIIYSRRERRYRPEMMPPKDK